MRRAIPHPASSADRPAVLTKATLEAARRLGVINRVLAKVLGLSEATISRMQNSKYTLDLEDKSFELAVLFVRLYRSFDAIVGGDDAVAAAWLKNRNSALKREPIALIQTTSGLTDVIAYLDARRALI